MMSQAGRDCFRQIRKFFSPNRVESPLSFKEICPRCRVLDEISQRASIERGSISLPSINSDDLLTCYSRLAQRLLSEGSAQHCARRVGRYKPPGVGRGYSDDAAEAGAPRRPSSLHGLNESRIITTARLAVVEPRHSRAACVPTAMVVPKIF
jgi:hypothetical protein